VKYYVVSDPHGFCSEMKKALREKGFFEDKKAKLIVCGDLMDRGKEAEEMQRFILDLMKKDRVILVRGNHEDYFMLMLQYYQTELWRIASGASVHIHNGTHDTALHLTGYDLRDSVLNAESFVKAVRETPFVKEIIPAMADYFETEHYIFVHGWIPCVERKMDKWRGGTDGLKYRKSWREACKTKWEHARWYNGMRCAVEMGITEPGKTIVCGHFHTSFGHQKYEDKPDDYSPFYAEGIIALDGCTAASGVVNCIVIED